MMLAACTPPSSPPDAVPSTVTPAAPVSAEGTPTPVETNKTEKVIVRAESMCTEMACATDDPCCNSCGFHHWSIGGEEAESPVKFEFESKPFPECKPDGCGEGCGPLSVELVRDPEAGSAKVIGWMPIPDRR